MENRQLITVSAKKVIWRVFWVLLAFELAIVFGDIFLNELEWISSRPLRRFFNITREDALANWFSSMQTLLVALTLFAISYLSKLKKRSKDYRGWLILAFFFFLMALDDGSKLHERLGSAFKDWIGEESGLFISYGWQIILGPVFLAFGIYMVWFLWKQLKKRQLHLLILAILLLAFAVGMDFVEGMNLTSLDAGSTRHYLKTIEEFLEMVATTILLVVFLKVLFQQRKQINIKFQ